MADTVNARAVNDKAEVLHMLINAAMQMLNTGDGRLDDLATDAIILADTISMELAEMSEGLLRQKADPVSECIEKGKGDPMQLST